MPRLLKNEIKGYLDGKEYYCTICGEENDLHKHIDSLLT